jgi:quinoprotein dehydrogenase-associated probable ABC transporter substrate-binding protein
VLAVLPLLGADSETLRVCADPNNLPFSNERGEGFENRIAELIAGAAGEKVEFVWGSWRKSLVKNTLDQGLCDALIGVPATLGSATVTRPYYRSSYVFVSRKDRDLQIASLFDSRLEKWRIGIHMVGDDYAPPAFALGRRGISANISGYSLFGAYGEANPPARLMDAVAAGDVDVAIVWGPLAGYFSRRERTPLEMTPVWPRAYLAVPFEYEIAMGVRKGNETLRARLDDALRRKCAEVQSILREYGVLQVAEGEGRESCNALRDSPAAFWH